MALPEHLKRRMTPIWKMRDTEEEQPPRISLNALAGEFHLETLHVKGTHANRPLLILINGGSTHNFIKGSIHSIARKLNLSLR